MRSEVKPEVVPLPPSQAKPEKPGAVRNSEGEPFGLEGTNKTIPTPLPDARPDDTLGPGKHVEDTPYTRKV
ncbi:MAG: hypothetical protein V4731_13125 [Pseudomonadota bacterium]